MPKSLEDLEHCALFGEKVSHALRTPLGVCLGALDDMLSGYSLGDEGLRDARDAARNIAKQLDLLRDFSCPLQDTTLVSLKDILHSAGLRFEEPKTDYKIRAIPDLFPRALRSLWTYLKALSVAKTAQPEIAIGEANECVELTFSLVGTKLAETTDIFELVKTDSRLESLGALFAAYVCARMDSELSVRVEGDGKITFIIQLSLA